jgi:SAM-dependent methyltransferase
MNAPMSTNKFVPKQALTPSPQLYDELVGDSMEKLAKATLSEIPSLQAGSIVHDNGCGTGAATSAIVDLISTSKVDIFIQGTDINEKALDVYKSNTERFNWPAEAAVMDSHKLSFPDDSFSNVIGNAFLFVLPNDGIDAVKENITMTKAKVSCGTPELTHFATMLWSFIGGTSEAGWLLSDEENWDKAIEIVKKELAKTEGYKILKGGKAQLEFIANIAIATK